MPATIVTSAPRARAASANAKPIRPEERFEIKRTGSIGSRVAPAVINIRSPIKSCLMDSMDWVVCMDSADAGAVPVVCGFDSRRIFSATETILSGSVSLPGPIVLQAISPSSGSMM